MTHTILTVVAFPATESGALPGNMAVCACGETMRTALSARQALILGDEHVTYHNKPVVRRQFTGR